MQNGKGTYFSEANETRLNELQSRLKPLTPLMKIELKSLLDKKEKSKEVVLSDNCKNYLRSIYLEKKYGSRYSFLGGVGVPQMVRGIKQEDWALKMISEFRNKRYYRIKKRLKNEHLIGSIDVFDAKTVEDSSSVLEIKTKETIGEFNKRIGVPLEESHFLQIQGYLSITKKELGEVIYCLVPPQEDRIQEQKELYSNLVGRKKTWEEVEANIRFLDIPLKEKIVSYKVERDEKVIDSICQRVDICRKWVLEFEQYHLDWINENSK